MKYETNQAVQRIINKMISETQNTNSKWHTLHNSIRRFYRWKISDNSDVIIPVGALNVNVDGFFDLPMQTCNHSGGVRHIG